MNTFLASCPPPYTRLCFLCPMLQAKEHLNEARNKERVWDGDGEALKLSET